IEQGVDPKLLGGLGDLVVGVALDQLGERVAGVIGGCVGHGHFLSSRRAESMRRMTRRARIGESLWWARKASQVCQLDAASSASSSSDRSAPDRGASSAPNTSAVSLRAKASSRARLDRSWGEVGSFNSDARLTGVTAS